MDRWAVGGGELEVDWSRFNFFTLPKLLINLNDLDELFQHF